jgi:hypothetical protein
MSLDEQVLVIAFCAVALKLFLWPSEGDVDVEPDRKEDSVGLPPVAHSGWGPKQRPGLDR